MVTIRKQKISDAKRFYEILNNPSFSFGNPPKSVQDEREWLGMDNERRKDNTAWNFTIIYDNKIVGAVGVKVNFHRNYIGEIGYFVDQDYWGKGIASAAVKLVEDICIKRLKMTRLEIVMRPDNLGSEKVAIKNNYQKEGLLRKLIKARDGKFKDCWIYSKII